MSVYRITRWNEYRKLAKTFKPDIIFYSRDPHPLRKPPYGLKLIFYHGFASYIFQDYADGPTLSKTKIPLKHQDPREVPLLHDDIESFIHTQIGKIKVSPIHAFWSL